MKSLKIKTGFGLLLTVTLILSSCSKWVEYNPHDDFKITEQDYLKSEADYRALTVGVYSPLQWLNQMMMVGEISSDNAVSGGESASDGLSLQQIDDFTQYPINSTLADLWQSAYEGINRANYLHQYRYKNIAGDSVNFAGKDAMYGEVYFLRAYYYFSLVRLFGDVPLFTDRRLTVIDSKSLQRTIKDSVYAQMERDLNYAITVLPTNQADKGRVTRYAAQALLGKVYLYQNKYTQAAASLENVISSQAFSLVNNVDSIFLESGENGPESVFEIQYSNGQGTYDWAHPTRGQGNFAVQMCGVRGLSGSSAMPYNPGWSFDLPTQNLADAYAAGDQRKNATIFDVESYKNDSVSLAVSYLVAPYKNTGFYNKKYLPRKGQTSGQVELNYLNNYRAIRYSDVLLMAAEANNKIGDDGKALDYLNQVRSRAFLDNLHDVTSAGTALYQDILNERRLELAMEGERFFDLVRTGKAPSVLGPLGFVTGKHEVFPIPQGEVDGSNLSQNPNY